LIQIVDKIMSSGSAFQIFIAEEKNEGVNSGGQQLKL